VGTLWRGLREDRLGLVNGGMLMLAGLIITRFFDSDLGFVVRGLAFIVVGVGFLAANMVLIRRKGAVA
jgi:dipeptide/tripeptide permease